MRRPPFRHEDSSPSSLNGMEKVISQSSVPFDIFEDLVEKYLDKPLPPTPRKPSSVYSTQKEEIIESYVERGPKHEIEPSEIFLQPITYGPSASRIPSTKPARPHLDQRVHAESDSIIERWRMNPRYDGPTEGRSGSEPNGRGRRSRRAKNPVEISPSVKLGKSNRKAETHAQEYEDALRRRAPAPPIIEAVPYYSEHDYFPSPISATITDLVDHSLMPQPLRFSSLDSERPSIHFSTMSSDSDADTIHHGVRDSLRAYARKAFHLPKASPEEKETNRIMSVAEAKYPLMSPQPSRRQSRLGSIASQRRASIQQGLSQMYDTLIGLSIGAAKPKPSTEMKRAQIPRELRSPAIPSTAYQQLGRRAWETPKSPKLKSPSKRHLSFRSSSQQSASTSRGRSPTPSRDSKPRSPRSVTGKLAAAMHDGTAQVESFLGIESPALQQAKREERREQLKRKIVVIGTADQYPDGRVNRWM